MKKGVLIVWGALLLPSLGFAQIFNKYKVFQDHRNELSFYVGSTMYMGDLVAPADAGERILSDLANVGERFSASFSHRYYFSPYVAIKEGISIGNIGGNDSYSSDEFRQSRNLHFKSMLVEGALSLEVHFLTDAVKSLHRMRGIRPSMNFPFGMYATFGIGAVYYNPKGQFLGEWYDLRDLGTEGQGLGGGSMYPKVAMVAPVGIGFRYNVAHRMYVGLQATYHLAFTDYLDDVGGNYYDTEELYQVRGEAAEYLADPSIATIDGKFDDQFRVGQPRGDASPMDSYMMCHLNFNYKLYNPSKWHRVKPRRTNYRRYGRPFKPKDKI